jgi:uncharacterized protein (TIGR02265 family)
VPTPLGLETNSARLRAVTAADAGLQLPQPDFGWSVDLDAYLAACPPGTTTRGTFFQHVSDRVRSSLGPELALSLAGGVAPQKWIPFQCYPLVDFMKLAHGAATVLYPDCPTAEGLRRIGWLSYESFIATAAGRIVVFALGHRFEDVLNVAATAYRIALPASVVRGERLGERKYRYEMRNVHSFVDSYHYGVFEGMFASFGVKPTIRVQRLGRLCDADFDLSW